jgi:hypothetical protein
LSETSQRDKLSSSSGLLELEAIATISSALSSPSFHHLVVSQDDVRKHDVTRLGGTIVVRNSSANFVPAKLARSDSCVRRAALPRGHAFFGGVAENRIVHVVAINFTTLAEDEINDQDDS